MSSISYYNVCIDNFHIGYRSFNLCSRNLPVTLPTHEIRAYIFHREAQLMSNSRREWAGIVVLGVRFRRSFTLS